MRRRSAVLVFVTAILLLELIVVLRPRRDGQLATGMVAGMVDQIAASQVVYLQEPGVFGH